MKHRVILKYSNVHPTQAPILNFDGPVAIPHVGMRVGATNQGKGKVTDVSIIYGDDVCVAISIDADGIPEDSITHEAV